jgi:hypothetical protein
MRFRSTILLLVALAACADDPTGPKVSPAPEAPRALGLVEITFSRLGTGEMSATVTPVGLAGGASRSVSAVPGAVPGGSIQLGLRTTSTVDAGGQRFLQAVFRVRNARADGTPNARVLRNVTFIPVSTSQTIPGTPVLRFLKQDGSPADPALAAQLKPTGAVADNGSGGLASQYPDVLQAYTEEEVAAIDMSSAPAVTNRFPYGFVTRRVDNGTTRDLPASPAPDQFDGAVTFAYRFPTQSSVANNPFTISIVALAVEDDVTRITQSIEEQGAGQAAFEARAASLSASEARILAGGGFNGPVPRVVMCSVRTAGTRESPTAFIGNDGASLASLTPNPYAGSFIARDAALSATFNGSVSGAGPGTFAVHGFQSAGTFLDGSYGGNGTPTVTYSHAGAFFPGEEVEVSLTSGLACTPHVARLRVGTAAATGRYAGEVFPIGAGEMALTRDFNGDGNPDVATPNRNANTVSVVLGDGTGRFGPPASFAQPGGPAALAAGDLNGDGRLDLVTANMNGNSLGVLLGDGAGGFTAGASFALGVSPRWVALGDLNGDGRLDAVTANTNDNTVSVLLGNGGGGFGTATAYPLSPAGTPLFVAMADMDGDGKVDVVVGSSLSRSVVVLRGNGAGAFASAANYTSCDGRRLALGDLNGDGRTDVVTYGGCVLLADGSGGFTNGPHAGGTGGESLGDLNGDGRLDLVGARVRLGLGNGAFSPATADTVPFLPLLGDLNGDGRLDVFGPFQGFTSQTGYLGVLLGTGTGGFAPLATRGGGEALGDVNGDGRLDVVSLGSVFLGDGGGGYSGRIDWIPHPQARSLVLGDVNGDGRLDAVTANGEQHYVGVSLGDGSGGFSAVTYFHAGFAPWTAALGDVNGDGHLDIVTANAWEDNFAILLGNGNGTFGRLAVLRGVGGGFGLALGDLNNDGRLDIASSGGRVLLGNGRGGFTPGVAGSNTGGDGGAALGDLNGDGRLDLARVSMFSNNVFVSLGDGTGGFSSTTSLPVAQGPTMVALGDLNGDGRLDVATANSFASNVSVLLGDGAGGLSAARHYRGKTSTVALGDLNGDGRLDILTQANRLFGEAP